MILLLIILLIVIGSNYITDEIHTYKKTSNDVQLNFIRIGNLVKIKVSATIESNNSISKLIQLSDIPDWAKPNFEEDGVVANSTVVTGLTKESEETGYSASKILTASFVKVDSLTYRMTVMGGNGNTSPQDITVFLYYLCK